MGTRASVQLRSVAPLDALLGAAVLIGVALRVLLATTRRYQVDEVEHVNTSFQMSQGALMYADFLEVHPPSLYFILSPLILPEDPGLSFGIARTVMLVPAFCTFGLVYWLGRRLHSHRAGMWGLALLVLHTTFAERGIEIRADMWIGCLTLGALCIEVSDWRTRSWRTAGAALLLGLACSFSLKAVFMVAALGSVWLFRSVRERSVRPLFLAAGTFALPQLVGPLVFAIEGAGQEYWTYVFARPAEAVLSQDDVSRAGAFRPWKFLAHETSRNLVFGAALLGGLATVARMMWRERGVRARRPIAVAVVFIAGTLLYLFANPYPYPYLHVGVLPALGVVAGIGMAQVMGRIGSHAASMAASSLVLCAAGFQFSTRVIAKSADTHETQIALMDALHEITREDDAVFDGVGLYFRPHGAYAWVLPGNIVAEYMQGDYPSLIDDMRERQTVATIFNYRTVSYLPPAENAFLEAHFVHYLGSLFVMGVDLGQSPVGETRVFEALKERTFVFTGPAGALEVDGHVFDSGVLSRGDHSLRVTAPTRGGALIMSPPGKRVPEVAPFKIYVNFD